MSAVEISEGIYWVGAVDWTLRDFHGYVTPDGATYNAYLVVGKKTALVDTVKAEFSQALLDNISEIISPSKIDYVIANHVEMDHSSGLPTVMEAVGDVPVVCTKKGAEGLRKHYHRDWNFKVVKTGDTLELGGRTLSFLETPMMHWPDSMVTYVVENKVLLSNDAFGQHLASSKRLDEDVGVELALDSAREYYANILLPLGGIISKKLSEVEDLGIQIDIIAPSHGVIWRNPELIVEAYKRWSSGEVVEKALVVYDTMWGSTEKMARAILEGIIREGITGELLHLRRNPRSKIINKLLDAAAVVIGSPTLNMKMYPTVSDFLTYVTGLKPKNKLWAAFGSYGWSGGAVRDINRVFEDAGFKTLESIELQYVPEKSELEECITFGENIAREIKKKRSEE